MSMKLIWEQDFGNGDIQRHSIEHWNDALRFEDFMEEVVRPLFQSIYHPDNVSDWWDRGIESPED